MSLAGVEMQCKMQSAKCSIQGKNGRVFDFALIILHFALSFPLLTAPLIQL